MAQSQAGGIPKKEAPRADERHVSTEIRTSNFGKKGRSCFYDRIAIPSPKDYYHVFKLDLDLLWAHLLVCYEPFSRLIDYSRLDGTHELFVDVFRDWSGLARELSARTV